MSSFFDKLKKGMGVEESETEEETEEEKSVESKIEEEKSEKKIKKEKKEKKSLEVKKIEVQSEISEKENGEEDGEEDAIEEKQEKKEWSSMGAPEEGQLAIDVYQTEDDLVIQSTIAGIKPENLDISIERDIVMIKGSREKPIEEKGDYFIEECFWGPFSREIIVPVEIDPQKASAEMKDSVLTIRMPKISREKKRKILVRS